MQGQVGVVVTGRVGRVVGRMCLLGVVLPPLLVVLGRGRLWLVRVVGPSLLWPPRLLLVSIDRFKTWSQKSLIADVILMAPCFGARRYQRPDFRSAVKLYSSLITFG